MGTQYSRFYDIRMALAVTLSGQLSIRWIEKKINQYMNNLLGTDDDYVIASDTDSIYLSLNKLVNMVYGGKNPSVEDRIKLMDRICEDRLQPYIDKSYQQLATYVNAFDQKMKMKREVLADSGIWTAKKRYVLNVHNSEGVQYKEPHLKVMGLELVRSSTPMIVKKKMKDLLKIIVNGNEKSVQKFVEEFKEEFKKYKPEDIASPRSVNNLAIYSCPINVFKKGTPLHVRGSLVYNNFLINRGLDKKYPLIKEGEKIKYVYLKVPNIILSNVISFPARIPEEFGLGEYIDHNTQFSKVFLSPMEDVMKCVGFTSEEINTLDRFFI